MLVVDDLHWADEATVGMLRSLARVALRTCLLIVGTYRETDLDRRHPFAEALPLLQREVEPTRIALDGLAPPTCSRCWSACPATRSPPSSPRCSRPRPTAIPFFLRETLLHLVDEGRLREVDGVWVGRGRRRPRNPRRGA